MAAPFRCQGNRGDLITSHHDGARATCAALLTFAATLAAPAAPGRQFASGVNLVEVYAAVVDRSGQPVSGLTRDDFTVLEDGAPQRLSAFSEGDFPLSVAVAIDRSFSMGAKGVATGRAAAQAFLSALRPSDQSMIIAIGSEVETIAPLSTDRPAQQRALARLEPWGTTGLHDAIIQAIDGIQAAKGRRALILLSDGSDRYSTASASDAVNLARRSDVMVYPVALGRGRPPIFAQLASLTGGRSFQPRDGAPLTSAMQAIAQELRHQYLLGYAPSNPIIAGDPRWRSITVRPRRADVTVRARDGYVAR